VHEVAGTLLALGSPAALTALLSVAHVVVLGPGREGGNTGYTQVVAKVMVSLPDDLLAALDAEAARRGMTRSGLLRDLADRSLRGRGALRAARAVEIMRDTGAHGGDVAALVKRHRPSR
jgi:ribbon-helix-helix CopG family protein